MMRPTGAAVAATAVVFLVAGVILPELAGGLLRLFVVALALVVVGVRMFRTVLNVRFAQDFYSPFDEAGEASGRVAAPRTLRRLRVELDGADDARIAGRKAIPASARELVGDEAARRLSQRRGLVLGDPSHEARIRARLSEPMWHLIRPRASAAAGSAAAPMTAVPLSRLEAILEELERL